MAFAPAGVTWRMIGVAMKKWLGVTVGLLAMVGIARADKALDNAVAKTASSDRKVRQEGVREIHDWLERFRNRTSHLNSLSDAEIKAELNAVHQELESLRPHQGLLVWEEELAEVVEVMADPRREAAREFLKKHFGGSNDEPVRWTWEETLPTVCGNGREWEEANKYVVSHCLDVARELVADPRFGSRGTLLKVLARLKLPEDRTTAMRFTGSSNPSLRASAVVALSEYPVETWFGRVTAMAKDRDPEVRYSVATVLGWVEGDQAVPTLIHLLADPYQIVAGAAHYSLLGRKEKSPTLEQAYLKAFVRHPTWIFLTEGIEAHATKDSIPPLVAHWQARKPYWYLVPNVLKRLDARLARKLLLETCGGADPQARWMAIVSMEGLNGDDVEEALLAALSDADDRVVSSALDAVGERKLPDAVPILREMMQKRRYRDLKEVERVLNRCLGIPEKEGK